MNTTKFSKEHNNKNNTKNKAFWLKLEFEILNDKTMFQKKALIHNHYHYLWQHLD